VKYVPEWWEFVLLALATFRVFHLIAEDTILDRPRRKLLRLAKDWEEGDDFGDEYRLKWAIFITCVWCLGWWIGLGWWGLWLLFGDWTLVAATPWALSAVVAAIAVALDR
jgi:hypothetical protein